MSDQELIPLISVQNARNVKAAQKQTQTEPVSHDSYCVTTALLAVTKQNNYLIVADIHFRLSTSKP